MNKFLALLMKKIIPLLLIILLALFLRVYKLDQIPPSLSWDEAAVGYDAFSILYDGQDQWGEPYPVVFKSFGEFKYPLHIYATSLSMALFGVSDFSVRFPSAFFGVINVLLIFFVAKKISGNYTIGLLASFLMAISPWHLQFSRANWETNFALFFFFCGLLFFQYGLLAKKYLLIPSFVCFGITLFTYNAAKVFIPLFIVFLVVIYGKELLKNKKIFLFAISLFILIAAINFLNPQLSGLERFKFLSFEEEKITQTNLYNFTGNRKLAKGELILKQYFSHFSPTFLFIFGDENPRHSIQSVGQLYWFDLFIIPFGAYILFIRMGKEGRLILMWVLLSFIPASIVKEAPHASRSMFALGAIQIISSFGAYYFINLFKKKTYNHFAKAKNLFIISLITIIVFTFSAKYLYSYYVEYPYSYSKDWQYGYKQFFTQYQDAFFKYEHVLVSDHYGQPYIFALYYLKFNPKVFRETTQYSGPENWGFSTVKSFANFVFAPIIRDNLPKGKLLVLASPAEKLEEIPVKVIYFLNGEVAFYVYEINQR